MPKMNPSRLFMAAAVVFILAVVGFTYWTITTPAAPAMTAIAAATVQPLTLDTLQERWTTLQTHTQHGMLTLDQRMEQMGQLGTDAQQLLASTEAEASRQAITGMLGEIVTMARGMAFEIEAMPAARRGNRSE